MDLDLTPFGFTPTESLVYTALVRRGPSGGYPIANDINVARANVYQALSGLVQKGAAVLVSEDPKEYRAIATDQMFAMIVDQESRKIDSLERQLRESEGDGERSSTPVASARALMRLIAIHAARGQAEVGMLATVNLLRDSIPVWRKRQTSGEATKLCPISGPDDADLPVEVLAPVDEQQLRQYFGSRTPCLFYSTEAAFAGVVNDEGVPSGGWTTDPLQIAVIRAAFDRLMDLT